jgi:hypothetical protein
MFDVLLTSDPILFQNSSQRKSQQQFSRPISDAPVEFATQRRKTLPVCFDLGSFSIMWHVMSPYSLHGRVSSAMRLLIARSG